MGEGRGRAGRLRARASCCEATVDDVALVCPSNLEQPRLQAIGPVFGLSLS